MHTTSPQNPAERDRVIDFRGVLVRDLIDRAGPAGDAGELTFVSIDAFRSAVSVADARRFRMLLAIEADGQPLQRSAGGPIFLVHPHSEQPEVSISQPLVQDTAPCEGKPSAIEHVHGWPLGPALEPSHISSPPTSPSPQSEHSR